VQRHPGRLLELGAIVVPSTILSIAIGAVNGYALSFWRPRGAGLLFAVLMMGAFIPVQVMVYPLVRVLAAVNLFSSLPGIVLIHTIFGMPVMTLLFRNYYAALPMELFKAARIDGGGFWRIFLQLMLPMSTPIIVVAVIMQVTGIWNDFLLGLVFAGSEQPADDGPAEQHHQHHHRRAPVQRQHGGDHPDVGGAAGSLFHLRPLVRARYRLGAVKG
jgi:ABC-type glycerol-3-phosphate transport system permease component